MSNYSGIEDSCGINFLLKEIPEARGIMDIGSYDGGDAFVFLQHYPEAEIVSVEASPILYKKINKIPSIKWHNLAIGRENKIITLQQSFVIDKQGKTEPHCATKYLGSALNYLPFEIQQTTLANLWKSEIVPLDILWIDVDGMDLEVLQGLGDLRPQLISCEHNGNEWWQEAPSQSEIYYLLTTYGYRRIWENHHTCVWKLIKSLR
jgi:FkbM family methyltransferase